MRRAAFVAIGLAISASAGTHAQWPQWRGPTRDGTAPVANVPASGPEKPTLRWKQPAGEGYSSPVVDGGRVFVHSRRDPQEIVTAFDLASGNTLWRATYDAAFTKNQYAAQMAKGPFSTPLVAGGQLYTLGVTAVLSAFDASTGALKWRKDFSKEIDTSKLFTGTAPGDTLILSGTRKGTFGFRLETSGGKGVPRQIWHNAELPMYMSTPVADGPMLFGFSNRRKGQLFCLDARTGTATWTTDGRAGTNASLVSAGPNLVVLTTEGELIVLRRNPDRYEEVRRYKVSSSATWAHPVLLSDAVVVRDANTLSVWALK